jgi:hypothetical protein
MRSPFALTGTPGASKGFVVLLGVVAAGALLLFASAPTAGALPRDAPEKASPLDVPEIEVPDVEPAVPVELMVLDDADVVVVAVALGGVPRAAEEVWAWAVAPASAITTEVAMKAGDSLRMEVS